MVHILQADKMRRGRPAEKNQDTHFQLFYDETNNFRKFRLDEDGLNEPNHPFVLGGIALKTGVKIEGWRDLRKALGIQDNAPEVKLKHLAKGEKDCDRYEFTLAQSEVSTLLQWLIDQEMMIHHSALDPLYFSILDIIESLQAEHSFDINAIHQELKGELHFAVLQDTPKFLGLMHRYGFPNVQREDVRDFLVDVESFVLSHLPSNRNGATFLLKHTLRKAARCRDLELVFLHDNAAGELVEGLGNWFMHPIYTFKNAVHVFDEETEIQKYLKVFEIRDGDRRLDYSFIKSPLEIGVQLSDVIAGIFGRYFRYLNSHSMTELARRRSSFTAIQVENLGRLRTLVERSISFSGGLFFRLMPADTLMKNAAFLHDEEIPPFMWEI
ncbi:DUF3800 domain-containing protein [Pseudomonas sp. GM_Psu_2]|uniref:DUF3800 domain-containing protein n=1 Tax=unclassified Pseudomonas TaxID=196821 RepID=UPI002269FE28|nr:DUF3800 domain-containing protein [Pseudomonas sp. GM_Psu_2]